MHLQKLALQNFRNYEKSSFEFDRKTLVVGPNTSGKSNLIEAISLLSQGKSFKTDKDIQIIGFNKDIGRVKGKVGEVELEIVLTKGELEEQRTPTKKFLINGVAKRRTDFVGNLPTVIFSPLDLEIIIGSPSKRRNFMDEALEEVDFDYRLALAEYEKGIRQRNSLLELTRKLGKRDVKQFEYWDDLVIKHGQEVTKKREEFIAYLNSKAKDIFDFAAVYDKSIISYDRLLQYQEEEFLAGVTLVGPHRDDLILEMYDDSGNKALDIKFFGSRGQQRLTVLQLKLLQINFFEERKNESPLLLLDDIFSELDEAHITHVLEMLENHDTVITTTHEEFVPQKYLDQAKMINLSTK